MPRDMHYIKVGRTVVFATRKLGDAGEFRHFLDKSSWAKEVKWETHSWRTGSLVIDII